MKAATIRTPIWQKATAILAAGAMLLQTSCTTTGTAQRALSEPMTSDLEAQVMKETGISGAAIGALVGGLAAGGATFLAMTAAGAKAEEALVGAAIGGTVGAVGGGMAGYQQGKKEGQKLVAQAMTRDQVAQYIQGARAYKIWIHASPIVRKLSPKQAGQQSPTRLNTKLNLRRPRPKKQNWQRSSLKQMIRFFFDTNLSYGK